MRVNVYEGERLVGVDYTRENGEWSHKWWSPKTNSFERGSWRGRCDGENKKNWNYKQIDKVGEVDV